MFLVLLPFYKENTETQSSKLIIQGDTSNVITKIRMAFLFEFPIF